MNLVKPTSFNVVPVPTPFDDNLNLDLPSFANHLDFLYGAGIRSIIIGGTSGEGLALSDTEKLDLVNLAISKYPDLSVYGCIVPFNLDLTNTIKVFEKCEFLLVMPPFFIRPTQDDIIDFYRYLLQKCHHKIILYNNPSRTMIDISSMYEALSMLDARIIAVKETQFEKLPPIKWYCGEDVQILPLHNEFYGIMSVASNLQPELTERIASDHTDQDKSDWFTLLNKLKLAPNPLIVKYLLWKSGIFTTPRTRFPIKIPTDLYVHL